MGGWAACGVGSKNRRSAKPVLTDCSSSRPQAQERQAEPGLTARPRWRTRRAPPYLAGPVGPAFFSICA